MNLIDLLELIHSREDLAEFIDQLRQDFESNPEGWQNADIASYLEAMSAWLRDMDGYYQNLGQPVPNSPTWRLIGDILIASKIYE